MTNDINLLLRFVVPFPYYNVTTLRLDWICFALDYCYRVGEFDGRKMHSFYCNQSIFLEAGILIKPVGFMCYQ